MEQRFGPLNIGSKIVWKVLKCGRRIQNIRCTHMVRNETVLEKKIIKMY